MTRTLSAAFLSIFVAATAFAHAGHVHNFLGTVKSVHGSALTIVSTESKEVAFVLTPSTSFIRDGKAVSRQDLASGERVAVHVTEDGHTATIVRIGGAK